LVKQQHQLFVALLCAADGVVIALAAAASWMVRRLTIDGDLPELPGRWETYLKGPLILFAIPIGLVAIRMCGLYRPRRDRSLVSEMWSVLQASTCTMVGMIVVLVVVGNSVISDGGDGRPLVVGERHLDAGRFQLLTLAALLPVMLGVHRWCFRVMLRFIRRRGWNLRHVAVIGVGRIGRIACQTIERNSWTGISVTYFVSHKDQNRLTECCGHPVLGGLADLERLMEIAPVDAVYVAMPNSRAALLPRVLQRLEKFAVDVRIVPDISPRYLPQSMTMSELEGMPILGYRESPLHGLPGVIKRGMDIAGALAGILVFSPVMMLIGAAIRLSGRGPVIFRQRRVSLNGQVFDIYKFRTMHHVEDESGSHAAEPQWTARNDPRVTPIGRLLRRTSLDELPQLFNVLRGEMSLVGPRPERPELIDRFKEDWRGYMLRQHVRAGMTGWAQVHGLRGDTSLRKRLQYDLYYVRNWSIWLDLRILGLTLLRGFVHRNAH
jgi:Undecaprenyl-phosphate glucose phosphotransferase